MLKLPNACSVLTYRKHRRGRTGCYSTVPLSPFPLPGRHVSSSQTPSTELGISETVALSDRGSTACKSHKKLLCSKQPFGSLGCRSFQINPSTHLSLYHFILKFSAYSSPSISCHKNVPFPSKPRWICCCGTSRGALPCRLAAFSEKKKNDTICNGVCRGAF